jgi:hypothetical protein
LTALAGFILGARSILGLPGRGRRIAAVLPATLDAARRIFLLDVAGIEQPAIGHYSQSWNVGASSPISAAQRHPQACRDLVVRIAGYPANFVELSRDWQDDIIARLADWGIWELGKGRTFAGPAWRDRRFRVSAFSLP